MTRLSRRQALFGGLTLAAVAASPPAPVLADAGEPVPPINERLDALERRHNVIVGVHAVDIETGRNVGHRDAELFAVCSTFKTYAAAAVLQKSERGELALDQKVFVDPAEIVANSPRTAPPLTRDVLGSPQRQQLEDWMRANETSSMRAGLPAGWTIADKTGSGDYGSTNDVGVAYDPAGRRVLLVMMTRSQVNDPKAQNLRPLIAELTTLVIPALLV
jgi:beta-lactamase class A